MTEEGDWLDGLRAGDEVIVRDGFGTMMFEIFGRVALYIEGVVGISELVRLEDGSVELRVRGDGFSSYTVQRRLELVGRVERALRSLRRAEVAFGSFERQD